MDRDKITSWIIGIVIAVIFIGVIVNNFVNPLSNYLAQDSRSVACTKNSWCNLVNKDVVASSTVVVNSTHTLTETTDYVMDNTNGKINVTTGPTTNTINISYNYYGAGYDKNNATTRTIAPFIGLFFVLFILIMIAKFSGKKD